MEGVPPPPDPRPASASRQQRKRPVEPSPDYANLETASRCLWCRTQPAFGRDPDFLSHLTETRSG
eukprot:6888021-Lingulodinium_polyedra.AAC.1